MTNFCHLCPTPALDIFASCRTHHLTLAHLVEQDPVYAEWYSKLPSGTINIMDNSAFEMYKQGRPMYPTEKLMTMGTKVNADYIVMSDYPGEHSSITIQSAERMAPELIDAGFGTFFVPQSLVGDLEDLIYAFSWAANSDLVDYIGVSILAVPNAYRVEKGNKLQRFLSRWKFMNELEQRGILDDIINNDKKMHFLGMVDGPNEIMLVKDYLDVIDTWDSSAAVWGGFCGIGFDGSP